MEYFTEPSKMGDRSNWHPRDYKLDRKSCLANQRPDKEVTPWSADDAVLYPCSQLPYSTVTFYHEC